MAIKEEFKKRFNVRKLIRGILGGKGNLVKHEL
jgi:hypothetical protein